MRLVLEGDVPSPIDPPSGCAFHPRCPRVVKGTCDKEVPPLDETSQGDGTPRGVLESLHGVTRLT